MADPMVRVGLRIAGGVAGAGVGGGVFVATGSLVLGISSAAPAVALGVWGTVALLDIFGVDQVEPLSKLPPATAERIHPRDPEIDDTEGTPAD